MKIRLPFVLFFVAIFSAAAFAQERSSWEVIQQDIFNQQCVGCHAEGTSFARQSDLVLTEDVAYDNLIERVPQNSGAARDGLMRVSRKGSFQGEFLSFLIEKIDAPNQDHFYNDHPNYGQLMPLGLPSLTNGEIAFVKEWVRAGAPISGAVADENLLNDKTRYEPPEFKPLEAPEQGIQFHLGPFEVWPAQVHDREFLYFEPYPTIEDLFVTRYEISYRTGSHHFILFNYPEGKATPQPRTYRDLRTSSGQINPIVGRQLSDLFPFFFFVGSQTPYVNYYFPENVALRLPKGSGFDLNSHSVNRTGEPAQGEIYVNLHTVDRSEVQYVADYDNFGNYDISIPPNTVKEISKTFYFQETRNIINLWSHSHEKTVEFGIYGVGGEHDGELLYWTNDWEHPPILELNPPLVMKQGDGVRLVTKYKNTTSQTVRYGPLSSDEMQFMFYIYFPGELTSVADFAPIPTSFALHQNFPNPFNPETEIRYSIPKAGYVTLKVYDILGNELNTIVQGFQTAGRHTINFDASHLATGVYFYKLNAGGKTQIRKMILAK